MKVNLHGYDTLIEQFLNQEISVKEFERTYIDKFVEGYENFPENVYTAIEEVFFDVDAYTDLPLEEGDNPEDYLNENQLRNRVSTA